MNPLANPEIRNLKAAAQRLEPVVRVGKSGSTNAPVRIVAKTRDGVVPSPFSLRSALHPAN